VSASEIAWRCIQTDPNDGINAARDLLDALERELQIRGMRGRRRRGCLAGLVLVCALVVGVPPGARHRLRGDGLADMVCPEPESRASGQRGVCGVLAAAIIAVTLRLHLWFTSRFYPAELGWARARAMGWCSPPTACLRRR